MFCSILSYLIKYSVCYISSLQLQKMTSSSSKAIQKLTDRFNSSACESLEAIEFFKNRNNATPHDEDEGTRRGEGLDEGRPRVWGGGSAL